MEVTVIIQHLTFNLDGGVWIASYCGYFVSKEVQVVSSDLTPYGVCEPKKIHTLFCSEPIFLDTYFNC